ncbi:MAG TPA: serine hydrolase [Caulobacteraceae bacterium]|nr:serine hydrolase [Caulobacteraceae bacterium]
MALPPLPAQPASVPWPTDDWPTGPVPESADRLGVGADFDFAFSAAAAEEIGVTHALLVVQGGRLVAERYAQGMGPEDTFPSWSMAKSITQALAGLLVGEGRLDIRAPADVPEWRGPGDGRGAITLDQLLRMSSGLKWLEAYIPGEASDVIEMLFGAGSDDVAHFAAGAPLAHPPGTFFYYSSGTSNIVSRCLARALGASAEAFAAFMRERLFGPLGMKTPAPRFDAAGTFIGSSYCFASTRDFARFGLLYLRDGVWEDRRLLPKGWVDYARTPTYQQPGAVELDGPYGAHWWLELAGPGSFSANGYAGQFVICCPDRDLIIARNGETPLELEPALKPWLAKLAGRFGPAAR